MREKLEKQVETILSEHKIEYVTAYLTDEELIRIVYMTNIERILLLQDTIKRFSHTTRILKNYYTGSIIEPFKPNPFIKLIKP
jgi:hypothetical protein